jgi:hypothetical protein
MDDWRLAGANWTSSPNTHIACPTHAVTSKSLQTRIQGKPRVVPEHHSHYFPLDIPRLYAWVSSFLVRFHGVFNLPFTLLTTLYSFVDRGPNGWWIQKSRGCRSSLEGCRCGPALGLLAGGPLASHAYLD